MGHAWSTALRFEDHKVSNLVISRAAGDLDREPFKAIRSPVVSDQGVQLAVLTITAVVAIADAETAIEEAFTATSQMGGAPNDPTDTFQPALAISAAATNQSGLYSLLERLDGFMRLANLAAEVRGRWLVIRPDDAADITLAADSGSSMG